MILFGQHNVVYIACQHRRRRRGHVDATQSLYVVTYKMRRRLRILVCILYVVRFRTFALRILYVPYWLRLSIGLGQVCTCCNGDIASSCCNYASVNKPRYTMGLPSGRNTQLVQYQRALSHLRHSNKNGQQL